jgi:radical SAM enzyme (rSAM/lipoprotein system)
MEMTDHKISLRRHLALEIARKLENSLVEEHPLRQIFWECTLRCNLHCRHCGSDCKNISTVADMPKEDFLRVLDSVRSHTDPHKVFVIITGGEPLMRNDLEECGRAIYEKGFPWGMVSNGLFLSPRRFEGLLQAGLHSMTISLDGLEEDHNWMRGNITSFDKAVRAIGLLTDTPSITYDVVTCVNQRNIGSLSALRDFLIANGVHRWRLFTVFPVGRAAQDPQLQLSNEEFRSLLDFIKSNRKEGRIEVSYGCEGFLGHYEGDVRDHFYTCRAGITVGSVLADGSISACPSIRSDYHQGNIYDDDFWEVWQQRYQPFRDREWMRKDECASCSYFRFCKGNGMHLRDAEGKLLVCHLKRILND